MKTSDLYQLYLQYPNVTTDSRSCLPKSMFFALKGDNFNGNQFAQKALENGASIVVVDEEAYVTDTRCVLVDNVLLALQDLARFHRRKLTIPVIGITGSNGKTSTKELCAAVLKQKYKVHFTQGNLNNHIGVPLTLLGITPSAEIAIIEMGANHPGDIKELVEISLPDYGLITNVGKAHLEGFGSFEGVIKTKKELYDYILQANGRIFIDGDNAYLEVMAQGLEKIYYGTDEKGYINGHIVSTNPFVAFEWSQNNATPQRVQTNLIGEYNISNLLAAVCVGTYFGVTSAQCKEGIESYVSDNNRSQWQKTAKNELILDAYNANPTSMEAALRNFKNIETDKPKMVVIGDMFELGKDALLEHQKIVDLIQSLSFDSVYLVGKQFASTISSFTTFASGEELMPFLENKAIEGCYVLIKGSRSMKMERVVIYL